MKKLIFITLFSLGFSFNALGANISLSFPANCQQGKSCYIHLNPKTNTTDIILNTQQTLLKGINVLAAAPGKVVKVVDNLPDATRGEQFQSEDPCGNEVIIQHDNGWVTQYCHLKQGSIDVTPNQQVQQGQAIGQVGESGVTNFPKLGFMVLQNGVARNPFKPNLWKDTIQYRPFGLIDMGITNQPITLQQASDNPVKKQKFTIQDKQVVAWVRVYGAEKGDKQRLTIYMPGGKVFGKPQQSKLQDNYPQWFYTAQFGLGEAIPPQYFGQWKVVYQYKRGRSPWITLGQAEFTLG